MQSRQCPSVGLQAPHLLRDVARYMDTEASFDFDSVKSHSAALYWRVYCTVAFVFALCAILNGKQFNYILLVHL